MIIRILIAGCLLLAAAQARAEWPERPVRIIVGFAAGGNTDSIARLTAEWLGPRLGQNFVVEDRPGAAGALSAELVAHAAPDGYTLLMVNVGQLAILPFMTTVPYDPVKDFAPISIVGSNAVGLASNGTIAGEHLADVVAAVRAHPGQYAYASGGNGTITHLTMVMFLDRAGLDMVHVPYRGGALALADLLAGQVPLYFGNLAEVIPQRDRLKLLAVSGATRARSLPDVPTVAEQGYPGFKAETWNGLMAPAATPPAVIARLAEAIAPAGRDADFVAKLERIGVEAICDTPTDFAATLHSDLATWPEVVRISGARLD